MNKDKKTLIKETFMDIVRPVIPVAVFLLGAFIAFKLAFVVGYISSDSMEPTLLTGDRAIFFKFGYAVGAPERGDIVSFKHEGNIYLKRVVGIPGDMLQFDSGYVYVNGAKYEEPYLDDDIETNCLKTFIVPQDCYFMLGDNRENSYDSRYWANPYVKGGDVTGKYMVSIPTHNIEFLKEDPAKLQKEFDENLEDYEDEELEEEE